MPNLNILKHYYCGLLGIVLRITHFDACASDIVNLCVVSYSEIDLPLHHIRLTATVDYFNFLHQAPSNYTEPYTIFC